MYSRHPKFLIDAKNTKINFVRNGHFHRSYFCYLLYSTSTNLHVEIHFFMHAESRTITMEMWM
jgi:hypothetical protein